MPNTMRDLLLGDTIAAPATAAGMAALALIRVSGPQAFSVAGQLLKRKREFDQLPSHRQIFASLRETGGQDQLIDRVLVSKFIAPHSYTGEDVVEISCHGSPYIVQQILKRLCEAGARPAQPGEFTRRAFINGKIDLVQAEAIDDLIRAQTAAEHRLSLQNLQGWLSRDLHHLRDDLKEQCALLEVELDFSEDVEFVDRSKLKINIEALRAKISRLMSGYQHGRLLAEGIATAILGRPNVGKSSLLNQFLQHDRAIVSEFPGTTRDTLEEQIDLGGVHFRLIDTAGIRHSDDPVEKIGIERATSAMENADLWLVVVDGSQPLDSDDRRLLQAAEQRLDRAIAVFNKSDISLMPENRQTLQALPLPALSISAQTGQNMDLLKQAMLAWAPSLAVLREEPLISKIRHLHALQDCQTALQNAEQSVESRLSGEFIAFDLRQALDALGRLTGEVTSEEILHDIFSRFCIGK